MHQQHLGITDNGKTVEAHPGDVLVIQLEENPTTGYSWALEEEAKGPVTLAESEYELFRPAAVGGGGNRTFKFSVTEKGSGKISLKYRQPWSGDVNQVFSVNINSH